MGIYNNDDWWVGHFIDGGPVVVRARGGLASEENRQIYCHLILIRWRYRPGELGMPPVEEHERMNNFEKGMEVGVEEPDYGVQVVSLTGNGIKEWRYFTDDPDQFMEALNRTLSGHERYPVEIRMYQDPEWNALAEMIKAGA